jgi:DNA-binding transcriptional MerR regulator
MMPDSEDLDLAELAKAADVTPRTVRYYVQQGLLPSPGTRGPGTKYDRALLERLQLIKLLQREHWPLSKIRDHLDALDEDGVRRELGQPPELPLPSLSDSALKYVRGVIGRHRPGASAPLEQPEPSLFDQKPRALGATGATEAGAASGRWQVTKSTWERIRLTRDVELSIRRPLTREQNKLVDRLLEAARRIFSEED